MILELRATLEVDAAGLAAERRTPQDLERIAEALAELERQIEAGADSIELLVRVRDLVRAEGWTPGNVDCSVVTELPKLAPRRDEMQSRLAEAVGAPVSVKGRRPEGLGALGRSEGVACWAVAVITRPNGPERA